MGKVIHHEVPFDEGTKTKLLIYEKYLQAWLQVFIHAQSFHGNTLQFYDFFSGPGSDSEGTPGSPLILMDELQLHRDKIRASNNQVRVFFNDIDGDKIKRLEQVCIEKGYSVNPVYSCRDFPEAFQSELGDIGLRGPSLVFMDQFGVKHVTESVFRSLANCPLTDILFFIASDHKRRFGDLLSPELDISEEEIEKTPRHEIHRLIASRYRRWAPDGYHVGHFSIMKGGRIYGLVFGCQHWRGMEKFINIAWKLDPECGDANFPIEADRNQGELDLFGSGEVFRKKKLEIFKEELTQRILNRTIQTDGEAFLFCIENGISPSRGAGEVFADLKKRKLIATSKDKRPRYSSTSVNESRRLELTNGR